MAAQTTFLTSIDRQLLLIAVAVFVMSYPNRESSELELILTLTSLGTIKLVILIAVIRAGKRLLSRLKSRDSKHSRTSLSKTTDIEDDGSYDRSIREEHP